MARFMLAGFRGRDSPGVVTGRSAFGLAIGYYFAAGGGDAAPAMGYRGRRGGADADGKDGRAPDRAP